MRATDAQRENAPRGRLEITFLLFLFSGEFRTKIVVGCRRGPIMTELMKIERSSSACSAPRSFSCSRFGDVGLIVNSYRDEWVSVGWLLYGSWRNSDGGTVGFSTLLICRVSSAPARGLPPRSRRMPLKVPRREATMDHRDLSQGSRVRSDSSR